MTRMFRLRDEAAWDAFNRERNTRFGNAQAVVNTKSTSGAVDTRSSQQDGGSTRPSVVATRPGQSGPLTLPWPPSGNTAVRHAQGVHYLQPAVIAYRDSVATLCARFKPIVGRYRLHVHLSPPDARRRDADNALKSLLDALVKAGYVQDDSLTYMRELVVTTDDERRGRVIVRALAMEPT